MSVLEVNVVVIVFVIRWSWLGQKARSIPPEMPLAERKTDWVAKCVHNVSDSNLGVKLWISFSCRQTIVASLESNLLYTLAVGRVIQTSDVPRQYVAVYRHKKHSPLIWFSKKAEHRVQCHMLNPNIDREPYWKFTATKHQFTTPW